MIQSVDPGASQGWCSSAPVHLPHLADNISCPPSSPCTLGSSLCVDGSVFKKFSGVGGVVWALRGWFI